MKEKKEEGNVVRRVLDPGPAFSEQLPLETAISAAGETEVPGRETTKPKKAASPSGPREKETEEPAWGTIVKSLEDWRKKLLADPEVKDTVVTTVAAEYDKGPGKPWAVLVSTILSLRTKDEVTRVSSRRLLEKARGPAELLALGVEEITRLIYPAGFYRTKAASLIKISNILLEKYGGQVPADMDALLGLPGVGRKTANLVITEAFDMYGICVDIHVHRISNRAGWVTTPTPEKTEEALREKLPKKYWKIINGLLVLYGQNICRPVSPFCSRCGIINHCQRLGVDRSR